MNDFDEKFKFFKEMLFENQRKESQRKRKAESDAKLRAMDEEKFKRNQVERKIRSRFTQRNNDEEKFKENETNQRSKARGEARLQNPNKVKEDQYRLKKLSRMKRKIEDPIKLSEYELDVQRKKKATWDDKDRLREFRNGTKYNAIFICNCCHRRLFYENVEVLTKKLINSLNHYEKCIDGRVETPIDGKNECYICKTCIGHMKA